MGLIGVWHIEIVGLMHIYLCVRLSVYDEFIEACCPDWAARHALAPIPICVYRWV
jgi:hypothetical protein